jgi:hypothetical protein
MKNVTRLNTPEDGILHSYLLTYLLTSWPLVRERTISTERPPLVDEI